MRTLLSVALSAAALTAAWTAGAQGTFEAIVGYSNPGLYVGTGVTAGWTFATTTDITVTELGCLVDSFTRNEATQIEVGLWNSTGLLLASNTITSGSSLTDQSRYESVTPVKLGIGQYNVGVYFFGNPFNLDAAGSAFSSPPFISSVTNSSDIVLLGTAEGNDGFSSPTEQSGTANNAILGPNFIYQGPPVPEPCSGLLLGLGGLLLVARRRRQRL